MIKYVKRFIYFILMLFTIFFIVNNINIYNQTYIPKSNGIQIKINQWDEKKSKDQIINNIHNYCKKNNEEILFVSSHFNDTKEIKYLYTFLHQPSLKDFSYIKNQEIKLVNKNKILLQDLCGEFIINANTNDAKKFLDFLQNQGIKSEIVTSNIFKDFSLFDISSQMINTIIVIIILLITLNIFDKINNCKKYAILKLNGSFINQIWNLDLKKDIYMLLVVDGIVFIISNIFTIYFYTLSGIILFNKCLFILVLFINIIYISSDLLSYLVIPLIDIKTSIKNGTPSHSITILGYVLKIFILFILSINIYHLQESMNEYKNNHQILNIWEKQKKSYSLSILGRNYTNEQEEKIASKVKRFLYLQPYILIKNNELLFHPDSSTVNIDEGNVLVVNNNYINQNTNLSKYIDNNNIHVLIPSNKENQKNIIEEEVTSYISFQKELPNLFKNANYKTNYKYIPVQSQLFNWNVGNNITDSISINPIVIVVNLNNFSNNFYYACLTNKEIIFNDVSSLKVNLKKSGLEPYIAGITSIQSSINKLVLKNKINFIVMVIAMLLSLLQIMMVITFILCTFIEKNKKLMALNVIHGISNFQILTKYVLFNLILEFSILWLASLYFKTKSILYLGIGLATLEIIILIITNKKLYKKIIKILKDGY